MCGDRVQVAAGAIGVLLPPKAQRRHVVRGGGADGEVRRAAEVGELHTVDLRDAP